MSGRGRGMGFIATVTEGIAVAFDSLGANKVRSGLTILGVTIGVLVVMVMAAVITGINRSFSELMAPEGVTTFWVAHFDFSSMQISGPLEEGEDAFFKNPPLEPEWTKELGRIEGIRSAAPIVDLAGSGYEASSGGDRVEIGLYGVGADYIEISGGDIIAGRWFTQSEADRRAAVTVIDSATAVELFGTRDPIGRDIRVSRGSENARVRVVGIYRVPANLFAGLVSHYVWMPFATADKLLRVWDRQISFVVRPEPETELQTALDATRARMRQLRGLQIGEEDDFAIMTPDQMMALWGQLTNVLFAAMVGLSSIGLMVGGVGVIGIMMISVTERTREIGLRKAMGGRRRDIMWQFLVEAATLTLLGGATGMVLGGGLVWIVNQATPLTAVVPMWSIVAALAASILTGIGFGLYPASRAAGLDPIDALRYE
ncbi:MAG: FtsX-like permease family protein [Gemmatimonadales bacterium]|uniref:ABC transporter permease n=1 Tax=Candidatus Palauibacter polyketidifaciens TaxID=3056740 RepID=UPI0013852551|nr:ABC transporter permease [Candidatus Palauibacter polyketidifaciens]MDE2721425.1 ABC transporter permease [Candidatus Palauibacter polyketidifaciens]MXX67371.1 FtsX-like permease family protein [Gemmatimonadales bacterium]MYG19505.1 FtsX-like permease family protein [Gemmatimonadales bacterium]